MLRFILFLKALGSSFPENVILPSWTLANWVRSWSTVSGLFAAGWAAMRFDRMLRICCTTVCGSAGAPMRGSSSGVSSSSDSSGVGCRCCARWVILVAGVSATGVAKCVMRGEFLGVVARVRGFSCSVSIGEPASSVSSSSGSCCS